MAGSMGGDQDEPITAINITPFVDIILVVLIIFMVTTPMIMKPSIKVNLPKASTGENTTPTQLNIMLGKDGTLQLNGKNSTEEEISAAAKQDVASNPDSQAVISADQDVPHGKVVKLIDLVRMAGIKKFAISTEKAAQ